MKTIIKGEWEDTIYKVQTFTRELAKVQNSYFEGLFETLRKEGLCAIFNSDEEARDFLFDYIYNCDEEIQFEEYLCKYERFEKLLDN